MNPKRTIKLNSKFLPASISTNRGNTLVAVMVVAVVGSLLLTSIMYSSRSTLMQSSHHKGNVELFNITEGGLQAALAKLRYNTTSLQTGNNIQLIPASTLGNGLYEVSYSGLTSSSVKLTVKGSLGQQNNYIDAQINIACKSMDFNINNGQIIPNEQFKPSVTVLGAALTYGSGGYMMPVTLEVKIGSSTSSPFGSIDLPVNGNVNTLTGNPRTYEFTNTYSSGTTVSIRAKSWVKKNSSYSGTQNSHWTLYREVNSTSSAGWVKVLRNGDAIPNIDGFGSQSDVAVFLRNYISTTSLKMEMGVNDVIYLFEFGSQTGSAADYQDLVALVSLDGGVPTGGTVCDNFSYEISSWSERKK